jgi:hypothetical protein
MTEDTLNTYQREVSKIAELNAFHDKCNILPISEGRTIIWLFRSAMDMDNFVIEFLNVQEQTVTVQPVTRKEATTEVYE